MTMAMKDKYDILSSLSVKSPDIAEDVVQNHVWGKAADTRPPNRSVAHESVRSSCLMTTGCHSRVWLWGIRFVVIGTTVDMTKPG